jgi:DNA-binding NarL/FixJ family response regulator
MVDHLEVEADRLLREAGCFNRTSGIHTEKQIMRPRRRGSQVSLEVCHITTATCIEIDALFECLWVEIMAGAKKTKCSQLQIDILSLRRYGLSSRDIADAIKTTHNVSHMTVQCELRTASTRIQHTDAFGIMTVLAEVFKTSVGRIKAILFYK